MFKKFIIYKGLLTAALLLTVLAGYGTPEEAEAKTLIRLEALEDLESVAIREQPSAGGKVITTFSAYQMYSTELYAQPTPIKSDGASWYKVEFIDYLQARYYEGNESNAPYFYVNTKEVSQAPLEKSDKDFLDHFAQGRPAEFVIGDDMTKVRKNSFEESRYRSAKTKIPLTLYMEPDKSAKNFTLPAGSLIIDWTEKYTYMETDIVWVPLGAHRDMRDNLWCTVIDGRSRKVIGWRECSYDDAEEVFPSPPDEDGLDKVFIY